MRRKNSNNFPIHKTFTAIFDISGQKESRRMQREAPGDTQHLSFTLISASYYYLILGFKALHSATGGRMPRAMISSRILPKWSIEVCNAAISSGVPWGVT